MNHVNEAWIDRLLDMGLTADAEVWLTVFPRECLLGCAMYGVRVIAPTGCGYDYGSRNGDSAPGRGRTMHYFYGFGEYVGRPDGSGESYDGAYGYPSSRARPGLLAWRYPGEKY